MVVQNFVFYACFSLSLSPSPLTLLPLSLLPEALEEYFEHYGAVKEVLLKYDRDTHKSRSVQHLIVM